MKKLLAVLLAALSFGAWAQRNFDATVIKTTKLTDSLYMLEGELLVGGAHRLANLLLSLQERIGPGPTGSTLVVIVSVYAAA
jgi:hypothetical protein